MGGGGDDAVGGEDLRVGDVSEVARVGAVGGHGEAGVVILEYQRLYLNSRQ